MMIHMWKKKKKTRVMKKEIPLRPQIVSDLLLGVENFIADLPPWPTYSRSNYIQREIPQERWDQMMEDARKRRAIRDMRAKKFMHDKKKGNQVLVQISTDVLVRLIKSNIQSKRVTLESNKSILVMFDFPNGASKARDRWRNLLLSCDFKMIQLSVYTTQKGIQKELLTLVRLLGLEKWVSIFVGNSVT